MRRDGAADRIGLALAICAVATFLATACGPAPAPPDNRLPAPVITVVEAPDPVLEGTVIRVLGISLDRHGEAPVLEVHAAGSRYALEALPHDERGEHLFAVPGELIEDAGVGAAEIELILDGNGVRSETFVTSWALATDLGLSVVAAPSGDVHRNDVVVLRGSGFVSATEGESVARFVGTFTREGDAGAAPVDADVAVSLVERTARDRAVVVLTTALGGVWPGTFEGTMAITSTLIGGATRTTDPLPTTLRFGGPELFSVDPPRASVGERLVVRGAGFLGGADRPTETTLLRLTGMFTPQGGTATPIGPAELVPIFVSGAEVRLSISAEVMGSMVVSRLFGVARGEFVGTAVPITVVGTDSVEGTPVEFSFVLGPTRQIVHLRLLPGFYVSLERFGLSLVSREIEEGIVRRIEDIYEGYNLDVRLDEPDDFDPRAYAVLEIGGPDPNGNGLFGYDNSPGKDIGNLRLFDHVGGANAETQMDGYPGYGGVFVESLLWWSSHPDVPWERPPSSPDPDPLFDRLFDPVRSRPATIAEAMGEGDAARVTEVRIAIDALSSIIGETTAHELGHSLGMAQPYGSATAFHNDTDGDGCLMDRGGDRPLEERAQQPGAARTVFCYDEPAYLTEILGP
jgi:hypothetical protein